ncbi:tRNA pseudouridine(65) synthase TruC [Neisseriaceae bacterium B1]
MPLDILLHTSDYIAVNKPAGMLVHRSWLDSHETVFLMQTLRDQIGQHVYPVHRLDRPTSGVILLALNSEMARELSVQFEQKIIEKQYLAIVRGWTTAQGHIDYPLKEQLDDIADIHAQRDKAAQTAITDYVTLAQSELPFQSQAKFATSRYSLIRAMPQTGRKHQIRRHLKHIFHPIIGDTTHGDLQQNHAVYNFCGNMRLLLHAESLQFCDPATQQIIRIHAPLDIAWQQVSQALQLEIK